MLEISQMDWNKIPKEKLENLQIMKKEANELEKAIGRRSRILENFGRELLQVLYYHALNPEITDNNLKAEILSDALKVEGFEELGTGTNRIAFRKNGYVYKIALDRRGLVDNFSEYKRSSEAPEYFAKTYETNYLIAVAEYINLIEKNQFNENKRQIAIILKDLSEAYIFGDIGLSLKNYANWGYRDNGGLAILDYAYMHPIIGNEEALKCPKCKHGRLRYDNMFINLVCDNPTCQTKYTYMDIKRRMNTTFEDIENSCISALYDLKTPNFERMNETLKGRIEKELFAQYLAKN